VRGLHVGRERAVIDRIVDPLALLVVGGLLLAVAWSSADAVLTPALRVIGGVLVAWGIINVAVKAVARIRRARQRRSCE